MSLAARVATAAVGIPVLGFAVWKGGMVWTMAAFAISALAGCEAVAMGARKANLKLSSLPVIAILSGLLFFGFLFFRSFSGIQLPPWFEMSFALWAVILGFSFMSLKNPEGICSLLGVSLAGLLFTLFLGSYAVRLRGLDQGLWKMGVLFAAVWAFDTGGYLFGRLMGRRSLHPFSPKKSWEGTIGGIGSSVLLCIAISWFWGKWPVPTALPTTVSAQVNQWLWPAVFGFIVSAAAQTGDLFESAIKRDCQVKDSSCLLPGHGGFHDRFDSFFFAAPVAFWLLS
ncbi:MAG: hypothetical protein CVV64_09195 [Candidatus Wallbacteria bacterium HGW-Wallbacteria-1]|jgi:phosphatidate cytidylyltransferase|uniref:Phosphatidate cytidylyltransferase n=1 Tax=Candidatus Wallbacteria bacterium HGW-Wallbacteria-1 TaxID=2013854 RepID=A0A2N1PQA6_9BACT|nr:MAG: hypothetical protein CVV64_09195 [Candidatus Wallbacteria bacterium HGW-Wallbacteria-1]